MIRNIMTGEGIKPVEAVTEFDVSGIRLFTHHVDDFDEWHVSELSSGFCVCDCDDERSAIERARAKIANVGPEKVMEKVRAVIERFGVANEEATS